MRNEISLTDHSFKDNQIVSGTVIMVQSLDGNELQYDTLNAELELGVSIPTIFRPKGSDGMLTSEFELIGVRPLIKVLVTDPTLYKYGEEVIYKHRGVLVGKYYMTTIIKVGKTRYEITCVSPVGILSNSKHYGGLYNGVRFSNLLGDIIGGIVPFTVSPELENQPVYGWLPIATRRENLHQALFAMGAAAQKDANGDLYICPLSDDVHLDIPESKVFSGGSVKYPEKVTQVAVSEHTFSVAGTEIATLFEGIVESESIVTPSGVSAVGTVILFSEPMHDLVIEGGSIVESGVNYAVLAPSADCKLTGTKYAHTIREITRPESVKIGDTDNKITVGDATLVSVANSENVADRLMSYYSSARTISTDIVVDSEKAGSAVQITDPFGERSNGIITSMDIKMSNTLKARAEIVTNFSPGGAGNFYTDSVLISEDGYWTVPNGVTKIRVAIIGGGSGGYSGAQGGKGEDGQEALSGFGLGSGWGKWGAGGKGGAKGRGGLGGRILVVSLDVEEGQTFPVAIGRGGSGGVCSGTENAAGTDGSDTIFGDYSSAQGVRSATGYVDLFGSSMYGLPGEDGIANGSNGDSGGDGNEPEIVGDSITIGGVTYVSGARGTYAMASYTNTSGYTERVVMAGGGNGGGAAAGANGGDGINGQAIADKNSSVAIAGHGGKGADSSVNGVDASNYGSGGQGGNGGGGGGGGGSGFAYEAGTYVVAGIGGSGGMGSNGGSGASGCVLIYF